MKTLNGLKIQQLPFQLIKKGDLLAYNGPILSHFKTDDYKDFFMFWVDQNEVSNRWLLFYVSEENLKRYFNKKMSLRNLVFYHQKDFVYFIDINTNIEYTNITRKAVKDFPMEYVPGENSYFDEKYSLFY